MSCPFVEEGEITTYCKLLTMECIGEPYDDEYEKCYVYKDYRYLVEGRATE